jgi:hypothetical protein
MEPGGILRPDSVANEGAKLVMPADHQSRFFELTTFALLLSLVAGCSSANSVVEDSVHAVDVYTEPDWQARYDWGQEPLLEVCQSKGNRLLHRASWPGLGLSLLVRVFDEDGVPQAELPDDWFQLNSLWGNTIPLEVSPATIEREYLLVLLANPDALDEVTGSELADFLDGQPPNTQLALYLACDSAVQAAGFGTDANSLRALLMGNELACNDGGGDLWEVLATAILETERIGGNSLPALRNVLVVGGDLGTLPEQISFAGSPVSIHWLANLESAGHFPITGEFTLAEVGSSLAANRLGLHAIGSCTGLDAKEPVTLATGDGASCPFELPEGPGELEEMSCNAATIAAGQRHLPETVELLFSPDEREVYDAKVKAKDQEDFELQIRLGNAPPVAALAHLRGQTSLDCARKSYNVNLKGNHGRHILPGSSTDEFYLLSMCKDDRYFQQYVANILAAPLGLFPLKFGFVELFIEGETAGVYLLLEKTKEALLEDNSRVHAVIRRRFDPGETPSELKYPSDGDINGPAGSAYFALAAGGEGLVGEELLAEMSRRMDFDQFLRILAFQTLMGNGDYVDEMIFYSTEAVREGIRREWYQVMAWDMDDLFSACHHGGKHAMDDPFDILYCAEGNIEKAVMLDSAVYSRFILLLEEMMNTLVTAVEVDAALENAADALLPFFDDPEICASMTVLVQKNPGAVEPAVAKADILEHMEKLRGQYVARRDKLSTRIKAYHAAQDTP